jgi:hypothetical protein
MKVRLTADMLRLRLDQSDVDALAASGVVELTLPLTGTALRCTLCLDTDADALSASFAGETITVTLPTDRARDWIASDAISLEGRIGARDASTRVLVEKDLGCQHTDADPDGPSDRMFDHLRDASSTESA